MTLNAAGEAETLSPPDRVWLPIGGGAQPLPLPNEEDEYKALKLMSSDDGDADSHDAEGDEEGGEPDPIRDSGEDNADRFPDAKTLNEPNEFFQSRGPLDTEGKSLSMPKEDPRFNDDGTVSEEALDGDPDIDAILIWGLENTGINPKTGRLEYYGNIDGFRRDPETGRWRKDDQKDIGEPAKPPEAGPKKAPKETKPIIGPIPEIDKNKRKLTPKGRVQLIALIAKIMNEVLGGNGDEQR